MLRQFFSYYRPFMGLFWLDFGCAVLSGLLELAFPLAEVKRLLELWSDGSRASADVRAIAQEHILALEAKAASLQAIAGSLRQLVSCCRGDSRPDCPILEELAK